MVVKGPADVKVGDLVEFDPKPTTYDGEMHRGTVVSVCDDSITVRRDDGWCVIVRYCVLRKSVDGWRRTTTEVHPIAVIEPRDLWLEKRPAFVSRFDLNLEVSLLAVSADEFASIAREVEAWLREEPA